MPWLLHDNRCVGASKNELLLIVGRARRWRSRKGRFHHDWHLLLLFLVDYLECILAGHVLSLAKLFIVIGVDTRLLVLDFKLIAMHLRGQLLNLAVVQVN